MSSEGTNSITISEKYEKPRSENKVLKSNVDSLTYENGEPTQEGKRIARILNKTFASVRGYHIPPRGLTPL